jgi:acyl carrier protein
VPHVELEAAYDAQIEDDHAADIDNIVDGIAYDVDRAKSMGYDSMAMITS